MDYLEEHQGKGEVVTGLLYLDESVADMHEMSKTSDIALTKIPYQKLCPGSAALDRLQEDFR
jgi:2-oxoglutarate ferredoxin oxidoreductase subunit beta